jgi:hypothetical protein
MNYKYFKYVLFVGIMVSLISCQKELGADMAQINRGTVAADGGPSPSGTGTGEPVMLLIDEESIDNGNLPNNFSGADVNDPDARVGLRSELAFFRANPGKIISLFTGEVGDEGWFALPAVPSAWITAGPSTNGLRNLLLAGPGLGGGTDNQEILLDKIPSVTPLRAKGLTMLKGKTVIALVQDGDIGMNYGPLNGNLMGANLGLVAFEVLEIRRRTGGSSGSLPEMVVRILPASSLVNGTLKLFSNPPQPVSSSEPYDIDPPAAAPPILLTDAG